MGRSKVTVRARRFGLAVLPARIQASAHDDWSASLSVLVHHSCWARAESGSGQPMRSSSCAKVSTTLSAYRFARYLWSDTYLLGTLAVLPATLPIGRHSAVGASAVPTDRAVNSRRLNHFHMSSHFQSDFGLRIIVAGPRLSRCPVLNSLPRASRVRCVTSRRQSVHTGHAGDRRPIPRPDLELT